MSEELKPALINLRVFRIQKKTMSAHLDTSSGESPDIKTPSRKRIIVIPDSDSDCETNTPSTTVNGSTNSSTVSTTSTNSIVSTNITTTPTNGYTHVPRKPKSAGVIEKEQKVKYLLSKYSEAPGFEAYDMLSGVNFILPIADRKMADKYGPRLHPSFENWQSAASAAQANRVGSATSRVSSASTICVGSVQSTHVSSVQSNGVSSEQINGVKRKEPVNRFQPKMQKVKRRRVDQDDDSNDSGDEAYKDSRVFDSDEDSDVEISNELTGDKKQVLEFLQTATPNELQLMASCSKKKVDAIVACRPFDNWIDMVEKLKQNKNLSADLLNKAQEVLMTRNNIKQLMKKCTAISTQLERAVRADVRVKQKPSNMSPNLTLTNYQLIGLNWLCVLHDQGVNGILADEMGLGKTVQVISFLAHLKEKNIARNTHLVVVPSSTLENWQNEFEKWCPDLKVLLYYGSIDERRQLRFTISEGKHNEYDVILTTYTMVSSTSEEKRMFRVTPMHYVVFDEAHMLKNMNTQRYESLIRIKASKRILLTGTPLQNNLLELMSLLIFVMPNIFSEKADDLKSLFQKTTKGKVAENEDLPQFEREQIQQAKRIMKPFLLRRLKRDVLQDLPKKTDHMLKIQMVPTQEEYYVNLVASFKEAGNSESGAYNGVTMMSDLRKLSNHPLLLRYHYQYEDLPELAKQLAADPDYKDTVEQYIIDDLACMSDFEIHQMTQQYTCLSNFKLPDNLILRSGKFLFLDQKLKELKDGGHRVLIFSQYVIMLDVMEEYLKLRQHSYLRLDGSTPVPIRQQLIDEYTSDSEIFIFLLSTRAGGLGINLTAADTVIIHDIDFNPYNDKQAEDRCHRMGQTRPVDVYRLISKGTIEEGMWQLTQEKLKLEKEITSEERDENTDVKGVVNLLSSALGIDSSKATNLVSPKKKL